VAFYLLTTSQGNGLGYFRFSPGKAAEDLRLSARAFGRAFAEVQQVMGWRFDPGARVMLLPKFFKYNAADNPNCLKSWMKELANIPASPLFEEFAQGGQFLPEGQRSMFREALDLYGPKRTGERSSERTGERMGEPSPEPSAEGFGELSGERGGEPPLHTNPNPIPNPKPKEEKIARSVEPIRAKRQLHLVDDEFIGELKTNAAYKCLDIDTELGKLDAWRLTPKGRRKHRTQSRFIWWLNEELRRRQSSTTNGNGRPQAMRSGFADVDYTKGADL